MLSTFTQNKQGKLRKQIAYLGKPEEKRIYRADERGQLLKFFCALGLPYTPVEIAQLTAAYHSLDATSHIEFGLYVEKCFPDQSKENSAMLMVDAIRRYKDIAGDVSATTPAPIPVPSTVEAPKALGVKFHFNKEDHFMNNTVQHTPGPWHAFQDIVADNSGDIYTTGKVICNVAASDDHPPKRYVTIEERKANARLIAASPDLLAVLKEWMPLIESKHGWNKELNAKVEMARAAIAKAESK